MQPLEKNLSELPPQDKAAALKRMRERPSAPAGPVADVLRLPAVTLADYVTRIKGLTLDKWQQDLCARLEKAFWLARAQVFDFKQDGKHLIAPSGFKFDRKEFEQARDKGTRAAIAAPPQFGKSCLISQAYPAWIIGYDPTYRFRLATYNIFHSARFSVVIKRILLSPEHKAIFTDPDGHINTRSKAVEWSTPARER